jgi:hypothetical protein
MSDASRPVSSLTVLGGALNGKSFVLDPKVPVVLVGAAPACHFQLKAPGVGPIHAHVTLDASGVRVKDAGSPVGTFVNDHRVAGDRPLHDGDVLWLGPPGDPGSVMIQCRIAPSAPVSPSPSAAPMEEFVFDEGSAGADEFVVVDDIPFASAPVAPTVAQPKQAQAEEPEVFFVDELPPVTGAIAATIAAPPSAVTHPAAADEDVFFFADAEPAPPSPAPPAPSPPAAVAPKPAPLPLPAIPAPPRPAAPTPTPPVAAPAAPPAAAPPQATPAPAATAPAKPAPAPAAPKSAAAPPRPTPAPTPAPAARPAPSSPRTAPRRPEAAPAPRERTSPPRRAPSGGSRLPLYGGAVALALVVLAGAAYLVQRAHARPELEALSPTRARIGEALTLSGRNFASTAAGNIVIFGEARATVLEASPTRLVAEVPEVPVSAGPDTTVTVVVRVGGRDSQGLSLAIHKAPRIHGLAPDVAMPGEEVTLAGSGWTSGAVVRFGSVAADVIENTPTAIRVRVPAIDGPPGTAAPVTVAAGLDASNPAPFLVGRLPLIKGVQPASAAPGDEVTLSGRGFHWKPAENVVRIRGARAFVVSVNSGDLKLVVPWIAGNAGEAPVELRVPESESKGEATLTVAAAPDPVDFRFVVEPLEAVAASPHAVLSTALGPAFVLATSGKRSVADRALEAERRLNDAAVLIKASRDVNFEVRNIETSPILALTGHPETVLEVAEEDAAAYNEDWTKLGGKGGPVTRARLALWWQAVARDLVLLLVRGEKPQYAAALAPEGRVLADVFEVAHKTGRFGVPRDVAAAVKPPVIAALKVLGLRVPAQVTAPAGTAPAPTAVASSAPSAAGTASPPAPLRLEGVWVGTVLEGGTRRSVTVTFRGRGGSLSLEGGVSISMPLFGVEPQKDGVRFGLEYRGGNRYYDARWDGHKLAGRISSDPAGRGDAGAFELSPR